MGETLGLIPKRDGHGWVELSTETKSKVKLNWPNKIPATQTGRSDVTLRHVDVEEPGQILKWKVLTK